MASAPVYLYLIATEPNSKIPYEDGVINGYVSQEIAKTDELVALVNAGVIRSVTIAEHTVLVSNNNARMYAITTQEKLRYVAILHANAARDEILGIE